jgi:hypothetical protein
METSKGKVGIKSREEEGDDEQLETMTKLFYEEWTDKISHMVGGKQDDIIITKANLAGILKQLDLEDIVTVSDGFNLLDFHENCQAPFSVFARDLVKYIHQTSQISTNSKEDEYT